MRIVSSQQPRTRHNEGSEWPALLALSRRARPAQALPGGFKLVHNSNALPTTDTPCWRYGFHFWFQQRLTSEHKLGLCAWSAVPHYSRFPMRPCLPDKWRDIERLSDEEYDALIDEYDASLDDQEL